MDVSEGSGVIEAREVVGDNADAMERELELLLAIEPSESAAERPEDAEVLGLRPDRLWLGVRDEEGGDEVEDRG